MLVSKVLIDDRNINFIQTRIELDWLLRELFEIVVELFHDMDGLQLRQLPYFDVFECLGVFVCLVYAIKPVKLYLKLLWLFGLRRLGASAFRSNFTLENYKVELARVYATRKFN
jgi:hypothetical protein